MLPPCKSPHPMYAVGTINSGPASPWIACNVAPVQHTYNYLPAFECYITLKVTIFKRLVYKHIDVCICLPFTTFESLPQSAQKSQNSVPVNNNVVDPLPFLNHYPQYTEIVYL